MPPSVTHLQLRLRTLYSIVERALARRTPLHDFAHFRFIESDLLALETSLGQGFQDSWELGLYRAIDELVYEYSPGLMTVFMPRKPHPVGHLYDLMCTKSEGARGNPVPYCFNFLGRYSATPLSPADSARSLVYRSPQKGASQRPVVVTDSAFGTSCFCRAMEGGLRYAVHHRDSRCPVVQYA